MKRKLLFLLCALLTSVSMWAWTSVAPEVGKSYYLLNTTYNQFWYASSTTLGSNRYYGVTGNIAAATPVYVESVNDYSFSFYLGRSKYFMNQNNGNTYLWPYNDCPFSIGGDKDNGYYIVAKKQTRYLNAEAANGTCNFPTDNNAKQWKFIPVEEACAEFAEANYVQSAKGWEKVTSVSSLKTNPENYFYAIFSANAAGLMVRTNTSDGQGYYVSANNPITSSEYLFGIENYTYDASDYFVMKAQNTNAYYYPLWDHAYELYAPSNGKTTADDACRLTYEYANNVWNIKTWAVWGGSYWGLWFSSPSEEDYQGYKDGQKMAGNKEADYKGSFLIYRIAKDNLTSKIVNPTAAGNIDGWTPSNSDYAKYNGETGYDGVAGFFELCRWGEAWPSLSISQTLYNLPNGYYRVKVAGQLSASETTMTLTANGESNNFAANGITDGNILSDGTQTYIGGGVAGWRYNSVVAQVTNGTLAIVVSGSATGNYCWGNFDNFTLTYIGNSLPESLTPVSGKMKADIATAQSEAVSAYNSNRTASNLNTALLAIKAAEISVAAYAKATTYLEKVEELLATTNFYTSTAYNSVYGIYKAAYDDGTMEDATAEGLEYKTPSYDPADARYTSNTANDLLIPGWTIGETPASTTNSEFYINTWSTESEGSGDAADFANPFYEYWTSGASLAATTIYGTISGLTPNAYYSITANVRVSGNSKVENSVRMKVGNGTSVDVTQGNKIDDTPRYIKSYTAIGAADSEGNLTLTFTVDESSNINWLSFRDVNYAYVSNASANLKVNDGKLGTFIAPFAITLPTGVKAYSATSDAEKVILAKIAEGGETLAAGTPVIIYGDGVNVNETFYKDATVSGNKTVGALTGILDNSNKTVPANSYVLQTQDDTQSFYKLASAATGALNRCYVTASSGVTAARLAISIDEETAINAIEATETEAGVLKDGKFLIGGRIVVVKNGVKYSVNGQKLN